MTKNITPEWESKLIGSSVEVDTENRMVTIRFLCDVPVAKAADVDKDGKPVANPTQYFVRTLGDSGRGGNIEIPELANQFGIPTFSLNGWYPKAASKPASKGTVLATATTAMERLKALKDAK